MAKNKASDKERTVFFVSLLLTTFAATLWLLKDYISMIVLSVVFSIIVHPIYEFFRKKFSLNKSFASVATIIVTFFLIILPVVFSINLFSQELSQLSVDSLVNTEELVRVADETVDSINTFLDGIPLIQFQIDSTSIDSAVMNAGERFSSYIVSNAVSIGTSSVNFIVNFFIFLVLVFFIVPELDSLKKYALSLSPLSDKVDEMYIDRSVTLIISMIKSVFIIAFAQGLLGALFLWIAGVDYLITFTILMIILSVIPIVGTGFVTVPVGIYLFAQGDVAGAAIVLIGQTLFVSNLDNLMRAELLSRDTSLHPAVMLMAIIGGLQVFGVAGLLYGPMVVIFFLTSLEIYMKHYTY